jgi:hypothetical protein
MTGQHLSYTKHAVIEFGAHVQTHEEHSNNMDQRTMGCICLGPTEKINRVDIGSCPSHRENA